MTSPPGSDPPPRKARLGEVVSAVLWSFFGVRKRSKMQEDAVSIRPHQVIVIAGVAIAAGLVLLLLLIVSIVIRAAGT